MSFKRDFDFTSISNEIYLDSAATSKTLTASISAINEYFKFYNANVHRGSYSSAIKATNFYEFARESVAQLINANSTNEVVFTSGATQSLNVIANGLHPNMLNGDEILIFESEHHANILPWQALAKRLNMTITPVKLEPSGIFNNESLSKCLNRITNKTAIIAMAHASNALGNVYPIKTICEKARQHNVLTIVDGTQAALHVPVDVQVINCDFYVLSGHKMYASTGIGVMYGKFSLLETLIPSTLGGEMITQVTWTGFQTQPPPIKFEAGTGNIVGALSLGESAAYIKSNFANLQHYETRLFKYLLDAIAPIVNKDEIEIYGNISAYFSNPNFEFDKHCIPVLSFNLKNTHCYDVATFLAQQSIAVRAGHHCAMPLMQGLHIEGCVRISLACYNEFDEIDLLINALKDCIKSTNTSYKSKADRINSNDTDDAIKKAKDWSEKHRQILLASKQLPLLPVSHRNIENEIIGCEADVWLAALPPQKNESQTNAATMLYAYSNSKVVRGLLSLILNKLNRSPDTNIEEYLNMLGLTQYFSQGRRDGIKSIIKTIEKNNRH